MVSSEACTSVGLEHRLLSSYEKSIIEIEYVKMTEQNTLMTIILV
jgi:hypothetical protein